MSYHERLRRKRLGDVLVDEGASSKEAVITALHESQHANRLLSSILLTGNELTEYDLARALVEQYQLPFMDLACYSFHQDLVKRFPGRLLHSSCLVPLDSFGDVLAVACQEFPSEEVEQRLLACGFKRVFFYAALAHQIQQALRDNAGPVEDGPGDGAGGDGALEADAIVADPAWKQFFDSAGEAVTTKLGDDEDGNE